jgi:hypothetical protein
MKNVSVYHGNAGLIVVDAAKCSSEPAVLPLQQGGRFLDGCRPADQAQAVLHL